MKKSLFSLLAALALSLSAPLLADEHKADHNDAAEQPAKEEGKKNKKSKHAGHKHGEKAEKNEKNEQH